MGDFDFLDTSAPAPRRTVTAQKRKRAGGSSPAAQKALGKIVCAVFIGGGCMAMMSFAVNEMVKQSGLEAMDAAADEVLDDFIQRYAAVARGGGSQMELSVHAQMVMAACAQAKNDKQYAKWRKIYVAHCRAGGIPVSP